MKALNFLPFLVFSHASLAFEQKDLEEIISLDDLKALQQIIVSTTASCTDKIVTNPTDLSFAKRELMEIAEGVRQVISESLLTLALKKDYPTACHVLSSGLLEDIETSQNSKSVCILEKPRELGGGCLIRQQQQFPEYSYYWPKYFIEVSQKGNDPYPAFASGNKLYSANRKIANDLSGFVDLKGPYELTGLVLAGAAGLRSATSAMMGQGFDLKVSGEEVSQSVKTAVLTPFEKLRIRANQTPDQTSYEVNVWPVGLSAIIAQKLTVCSEGGFQWSIPGVPMTCPVAMSKDAWAYWDSGMIDYLNPNSIRGISAATNTTACIADNLASVALDQYEAKGSTGTAEEKGQKDLKQGKFSNIPSNLRGLGMCSMPILGKAEAIVGQLTGLKDSFVGPWCSLWGPVVPRMSTHVQNTDFGFATAALKFKLFAHDMFGIPRGSKERWSLAYPWEEQVSEAFLDSFGALSDVLDQMGIKKISSEYAKGSGNGRSLILMPPGDPRMLDVFNVKQLGQDAKNFAREVIYLSAINTSASIAEKQALDAFIKEGNHQSISPSDILVQQRKDVLDTVDQTAREKGEPVYEKKAYCRIWGEKKGMRTREEIIIPLPYSNHEDVRFERHTSLSQCMSERNGSCIDRHPTSGKCRRPESIYYTYLERWEISHYNNVQNPKQYVLDPAQCSYLDYKTSNTHHRQYTCKERLRVVGHEDTRDHIPLPDPTSPATTILQGSKHDQDTSKAGTEAAAAAKVATWVGAEIARARYEDITGSSMLPGKKRVYTIFEQIKCEPTSLDGTPVFRKQIPGGYVWNSCKDAVKLEVRKYFQTKLLRRMCDKILDQKLGKPFK